MEAPWKICRSGMYRSNRPCQAFFEWEEWDEQLVLEIFRFGVAAHFLRHGLQAFRGVVVHFRVLVDGVCQILQFLGHSIIVSSCETLSLGHLESPKRILA